MYATDKDKNPPLSYASVSRTGDREVNEDSVLAFERDRRRCFVAADGLGGHGSGDKASQLLTDVFAREFDGAEDNRAFLARAFSRAQEEILALQAATNSKMKTTAVALSVIGGKCAWGHVGDSRLYRFTRGALSGRTLDHSVPQALASMGKITDAEIAAHPDRSRLLRAVGDKWDNPQYEISKEHTLRRGTAFLLCTDGFWEFIPGSVNFAPLPDEDADKWLSALLGEVERRGRNMDNYSAIAVIVK